MVKQKIEKIVCPLVNCCPEQTEKDFIHPEIIEKEEQMKRYKSILSHASSTKYLDSYAKWVFASSGIVGALATGFTISNYSMINGWGISSFAVCIVLITCSLFFAAMVQTV